MCSLCVVEAFEYDVTKLLQDYYEWRILENPLMSYYLGYDQNVSSANNYSLNALKTRYEMAQMFHERAANLEAKIDKKDQRFLKMVKFETKSFIKSFEIHGFMLPPVTFKAGIQMTVPSLFSSRDALR